MLVILNLDCIIKEVDGTPQQCWQTAIEIGQDIGRETIPMRVFKQGPRTMAMGVLPVRTLLRILAFNATIRGATATKAVKYSNRPVDSKHVQSIASYLINSIKEDKPYILPPLTLNTTKGLEIYVPKGMSGPVTGYAILPDEQQLFITDGQHRFLALMKVRDELIGTEEGNNFLNNGIAIMVTLSPDMDQIHQDFADAAKTKQLPPSLVAVYDLRHPGNRAVLKLIEKVSLFQDRVDATSSTLSINSPFIFLANQVRQFVKSSLTNNPSIKDEAFYLQAGHLNNPKEFDQWVEARIIFLEVLVDLIPEWKEIASLPKPYSAEGHLVYNKMKEIRTRQPVSITAAALNAFGLLSFHVISKLGVGAVSKDVLEKTLAPLAEVNWSRTAPFWQGNLVQEGVIKTQTSAVRKAAKNLINLIEPEPHDFSTDSIKQMDAGEQVQYNVC